MKGSGRVVALLVAHELGRLERETRVHVTLWRIDRKPDFSGETLQSRANPGPLLRRKGLGCSFGRRLRVKLKRKPAELRLQFSRCLFGPN